MTPAQQLRGALLGLVLLWTGAAFWFVEIGDWYVAALPLTIAVMFAAMALQVPR